MIVFRSKNGVQYRLDHYAGKLWRGTERIRMPRREWKLLCYLVEHPGKLISKTDLQDAVWGITNTNVSESSVNKAISEVRLALGDNADHPLFIETVQGLGYCFVASVDSNDSVRDVQGEDSNRPEQNLRQQSPELGKSTLTANLDVLVWSDRDRAYLPLANGRDEPLYEGAKVQVRATVNPGAYLYVVWLGTTDEAAPESGKKLVKASGLARHSYRSPPEGATHLAVHPLYPWLRRDWMSLDPEEMRLGGLALPERSEGDHWPLAGPPGPEAIILLVRHEPLTDALRNDVRTHLETIAGLIGRSRTPITSEVRHLRLPEEPPPEPGKLPPTSEFRMIGSPEHNQHPFYILRRELQSRLTAHFALIRAVYIAKLGKGGTGA